ncbi:MAG TPA: DUF4288 domain-containing protein [Holophaga sp.]|nr:DUF4288 domain-containing protein [Holophaga sp.]
MKLYCAKLHMICLVDDRRIRKNLCDYSFFLIQAKNDKEAFKRALELGSAQETTYKNDIGQEVRWAFTKVESILRIGNSFDGVEIGSVMDFIPNKRPVPIDERFSPEKHIPPIEDALPWSS